MNSYERKRVARLRRGERQLARIAGDLSDVICSDELMRDLRDCARRLALIADELSRGCVPEDVIE